MDPSVIDGRLIGWRVEYSDIRIAVHDRAADAIKEFTIPFPPCLGAGYTPARAGAGHARDQFWATINPQPVHRSFADWLQGRQRHETEWRVLHPQPLVRIALIGDAVQDLADTTPGGPIPWREASQPAHIAARDILVPLAIYGLGWIPDYAATRYAQRRGAIELNPLHSDNIRFQLVGVIVKVGADYCLRGHRTQKWLRWFDIGNHSVQTYRGFTY